MMPAKMPQFSSSFIFPFPMATLFFESLHLACALFSFIIFLFPKVTPFPLLEILQSPFDLWLTLIHNFPKLTSFFLRVLI